VFVGKAFHTIDEKGRLVLPSAFRRVLEGDGDHKSCVLTQSPDGCLMLFRLPDFQRQADELLAAATNPAGRRKLRTFASSADHLDLDKAGRLIVNEELRNFASIDLGEEVAIVGAYGWVEIWNRDAYLTTEERGDREFLDVEEEGEVSPA
jgi:transcriptional regulator MraZ